MCRLDANLRQRKNSLDLQLTLFRIKFLTTKISDCVLRFGIFGVFNCFLAFSFLKIPKSLARCDLLVTDVDVVTFCDEWQGIGSPRTFSFTIMG